MSEYQLGSEIQHRDKTWRIVRIVTSDRSLFEEEGNVYEVLECYFQLKSSEGEIDFITLDSQKIPHSTTTSTIKALSVIPWRTLNA